MARMGPKPSGPGLSEAYGPQNLWYSFHLCPGQHTLEVDPEDSQEGAQRQQQGPEMGRGHRVLGGAG